MKGSVFIPKGFLFFSSAFGSFRNTNSTKFHQISHFSKETESLDDTASAGVRVGVVLAAGLIMSVWIVMYL